MSNISIRIRIYMGFIVVLFLLGLVGGGSYLTLAWSGRELQMITEASQIVARAGQSLADSGLRLAQSSNTLTRTGQTVAASSAEVLGLSNSVARSSDMLLDSSRISLNLPIIGTQFGLMRRAVVDFYGNQAVTSHGEFRQAAEKALEVTENCHAIAESMGDEYSVRYIAALRAALNDYNRSFQLAEMLKRNRDASLENQRALYQEIRTALHNVFEELAPQGRRVEVGLVGRLIEESAFLQEGTMTFVLASSELKAEAEGSGREIVDTFLNGTIALRDSVRRAGAESSVSSDMEALVQGARQYAQAFFVTVKTSHTFENFFHGEMSRNVVAFEEAFEKASQVQANLFETHTEEIRKQTQGSLEKAQEFKTVAEDLQRVALQLESEAGALKDKAVLSGNSAQESEQRSREVQARSSVVADFTLVASLVALLVGILIAWFIGRTIVSRLGAITRTMSQLVDGDLKVDVPSLEQRDEIGLMARAVQVFKENALRMRDLQLQQEEHEKRLADERRAAMRELAAAFENSVQGVVESVSSASEQLQSNAGGMQGTITNVEQCVALVAAAAGQASGNVQTVSSAAGELAESISEISRQVSHSSKMTEEAVNQAQRTNRIVYGLTETADRIGEVVTLISTIAEQTNLLALNATIEAARAGEAGKGFAVVAGEVKDLASQTARATREISTQIVATQAATEEAVEAIQDISRMIGEINAVVGVIASAVEEQGRATQEIAPNVEEAVNGTGQVSTTIVDINTVVGETGSAASQVLDAAYALSEQARVLSHEVESFIGRVRKD